MPRRTAAVAAAATLILSLQRGQAQSCGWTDERSGASWDLAPLMAESHYQFRGLVGADKDGLHASTITAYEDYTYFLNLCKPATDINFHKCDEKTVANPAVFQVHRSQTNPECFVLGSSNELSWGLSVAGDPSQGVALTYSGGDVCNKRIEKQVEKVSEPSPPAPAECNPAAAEPAAEVTTACAAHAMEGGGGKAACDTDSACSYKPPPPPEPPSTYMETVTEWVETPRKVTINITCDHEQGEDLSSLVKMAGSVIAVEPEMCEYTVHWPTKAGCPGEYLTGKASIDTQGGAFGGGAAGGGEGGSGLTWCVWLVVLVLMVVMYRDGARKVVIAALPLGAKQWLRSGADGSFIGSPRKTY